MSPEEFERLKAQEKAHLRKLQSLKAQARDAGRQGRLARALGEIAGALDPSSTYDETMDALARETAQGEARFEIASEAAGERNAAADALEKAAQAEKLEADAARARARSVVEQMKASLGGPVPQAPPAPTDKSLGRADAPDAAPPPASLPEKTLGRRR